MITLLTDQPLLAALSALLGLGAVFGALLGFAAIRFRVEGNPISEQSMPCSPNPMWPVRLSRLSPLFGSHRRRRCH